MAKFIAQRAALVVLALCLSACATAHRPDPEPIADTSTPDAKMLPAEFHHAHIGRDRLRGALPNG